MTDLIQHMAEGIRFTRNLNWPYYFANSDVGEELLAEVKHYYPNAKLFIFRKMHWITVTERAERKLLKILKVLAECKEKELKELNELIEEINRG